MKQPSWKVPLILSVSLAVVGTFAYWLEFSHKPKKEKSLTSAKKPISFPSEDSQIQSIFIQGAKSKVTLNCTELKEKLCSVKVTGKWVIPNQDQNKPALPADSDNVKSFITSIGNMVATETIDLSEDTLEKRTKLFEEYGLSENARADDKATRVEFKLEGGETLTAWLGTEHPIGDKVFAASAQNGKLNDATVFLISNYLKQEFDHDLNYFRDKSVFSFNRSQVTEVRAKTLQGSFQGLKNDNAWTLNGLSVDYDRFEALISTIAQMKGKAFADQKSLQGARSTIRYDLSGPEDFKASFEIFEKTTPSNKKGAPGTKTYWVRTPHHAEPIEIEATTRILVDKKANDYRTTTFFSTENRKKVVQITLAGSKFAKPVTLAFADNKWTATNGSLDEKIFSASKISALLDLLASGRIKEYQMPAPAMSKDTLTITMGTTDNPKMKEFKFYKSKNELYLKNPDPKRVQEALWIEAEVKNGLPI